MKLIKPIRPVLIAAMSTAVYYILYRPPLDPSSPELVTALMAFFASLGWSAVIIFTNEQKPVGVYIYTFIAVCAPVLMFFFFKGFDIVMHSVAFGLLLIAQIGLRLFVVAHVKHQLKKTESEASPVS